MKKTASKRRQALRRRLHERLTSLETQLIDAMEQHLARTGSSSREEPIEFMDVVSHGELDDLAARIAESDSHTIGEVEEALRMLQEGRYGLCGTCGERISRLRLKARPFATLCIACKREQETRQPGSSAASEEGPGMHADIGAHLMGREDDLADDLGDVFQGSEASELL